MCRAAASFLVVVTAAFCVLAPSAAAQPVGSSEHWNKIGELSGKRRITVQLKDGGRRKGSAEQFTEAGFVLRERGGSMVPVDRVSVSRVTRKSRARGALYGLIVGFGAGFAIGATAGPYITDYGNPGAVRRMKYGAGWALFFGGAAAGVGALTGAQVVVYR